MKKSIKISELISLLTDAAKKYVTPEEAEYFANEQVEDHVKRGHYQGFTTPLAGAISDIKSWQKKPGENIQVILEKNAVILINLNELGPTLKLKYIHDTLVQKAKQFGIAAIGLNNPHEFLDLSVFTTGLAKRNIIGIALCNGGPEGVVPDGAIQGVLGTNPISYAIPTTDYPIVADFATSQIPFFRVLDAKKNNLPLDNNAALDNDGQLTTDVNKAFDNSNPPHELANILPMGGDHKGYAIVLLIEIITGSLIRSFLSTEMKNGYVPKEHGMFLLAIDISSLTDLNSFKKSVSEMCDTIRLQKPKKGIKKVLIPGDSSQDRYDKAFHAGVIDIEESLYQELMTIAN
jgi:L-2-hydroxycarboxylate dehydrogenase (NAD+)